MTKVELFEEFLEKPYEEWSVIELNSIAETPEIMNKFFDEDVMTELLARKNDDIHSMIYALYIAFRFSNANNALKEAIIKEDLSEEQKIKNLIETLNSNEIFVRINSYLVILSGTVESEELLSMLNEEKLKADMDEIQNIMVKLDPDESFDFIIPLLETLYRIQEFYFERTEKNVLVETDEFSEMCGALAEEFYRNFAETVDNQVKKIEEENIEDGD